MQHRLGGTTCPQGIKEISRSSLMSTTQSLPGPKSASPRESPSRFSPVSLEIETGRTRSRDPLPPGWLGPFLVGRTGGDDRGDGGEGVQTPQGSVASHCLFWVRFGRSAQLSGP